MINLNTQYVLATGILFFIIVDLLRSRFSTNNKKIMHILSISILVVSLITEFIFGNLNTTFFSMTQFSYFINGFILFLAVLIYAFMYLTYEEYSTSMDLLFMFAVLGATLAVISSNFVSLLISIELLSIPSYGMIFFEKNKRRLEGAVKYVATSFISMVILIFGISLVYGGAGSLNFSSVALINYVPLVAGISLVVVGLAFKSTLVPFHMWAPDVYEAAASPITSFLASISKAAGLIAITRVFFFAFPLAAGFIQPMFVILALSTLFFASFLAIIQERIKRILVYASIAQAGFAFIGISLLPYVGAGAAVFYIFSFAIADCLVFLAYTIFEEQGIKYKKDIAKIPKISRISTIAFSLGLLSLAGLPPTIGFFGKLLIFQSLLVNGYFYFVIAVFAILLFSAFYYLSLLREINPVVAPSKSKYKDGYHNLRYREIILSVLVISLFIGVSFVII